MSPAVSPTSVGISKLGGFLNVSAPVVESMSNLPPSSSGFNEKVNVEDASTSVASKSTTVPVPFSAKSAVAGGDVNTGASLTSVTVTVNVSVSLIAGEPSSVTFTVTT